MRRFFSLLLLLSGLSSPALAARGCGSTFGTNTSDTITSTYAGGFSGTSSYFFWAWVNGSGGAAGGRVFNKGATVATVDAISMIPGFSFFPAFSTTRGTFTMTVAPSSSAWHAVVVTYDGSATTNVPVMYLDGASVAVTTAVTPVGTRTSDANAYVICNTSAGNRNFDGMLSDFTLWNVILTANEAKALSSGASPLKVRPGALVYYAPLRGNWSTEPDWGPSRAAQTLTGTKLGTKFPPAASFPFNQNHLGY